MKILVLATVASLAITTGAIAQGAKYDTDGDNVLSPQEFESGPMRLGQFGQYDTDSSGTVDLTEFMSGIADMLKAKRDDGTLNPEDAREIREAVMSFN